MKGRTLSEFMTQELFILNFAFRPLSDEDNDVVEEDDDTELEDEDDEDDEKDDADGKSDEEEVENNYSGEEER